MLKISRTRLLAAALGCLAIAATSISLAQDQQSNNQSNQSQPATQSSPPTGLQLDAAGTTQEKSSDQASQQSSQSNDLPSSLKSSSDSQSSGDQAAANSQKSNASSTQRSNSSGNASSSASGNRDWPAPQRYNPNNPQGGSLGISISADGQGIRVSRVHSGTPAEQMGLRPRDRITSVNGQQVSNPDQFISIIRNMNAGEQVELAIVRDDAPTTVKGKLEAYSQALARTPEAREGGDIRTGRSRGSRDQLFDLNPNVQTSYEERTQSGRQGSGDIESRLTNLEQQLSQLRQDVAEIRAAVRSNPSTSTSLTSPTSSSSPNANQPPAGAIQPGQSGPRTPSVFPRTPGEPPSVQRNAGQPPAR